MLVRHTDEIIGIYTTKDILKLYYMRENRKSLGMTSLHGLQPNENTMKLSKTQDVGKTVLGGRNVKAHLISGTNIFK